MPGELGLSSRSTARAWLAGALLAAAVVAACDGRRADGAVPQPPREAAAAAALAPAAPLPDSTFARLIAELSEPGGYFDTDNLISNEASYLHVAQDLRELRGRGGAYIGVGPDQNFSYIAALRPTIAFILDIRRDNMLQHLFFKALFELSPDRLTYLGLLFGREVDGAGYDEAHAGIETLVERLDAAAVTPESRERALRAVQGRVQALGVPLSAADLERIDFIHRSFIEAGPDIRFTSHGRRPQFYYPTYRQLLLERDRTGLYANYLASAEDFRFVKEMQERNLVIPVVGDFAGPHALAAVGREIERRGERVVAFYTSNVEFYLMMDGVFDRFARTVAGLPRADGAVIVRSYFNRGRTGHPATVPGYYSTQLLQDMGDFVEAWRRGEYGSYSALVMAGR
nr:MAG: hypothetical protein DIU52_14490 [bacterium]